MLVDQRSWPDHATGPLDASVTDPGVEQSELAEKSERPVFTAAEFFAGIGLARLGLEKAGFDVVWSNDIEPDKQDMYVSHFMDGPESHHYVLGDIGDVKGHHMPSPLTLAWASFPCTDLSLAGGRKGLKGKNSGTFWQFTRVLREMDRARPPLVALENVNGFATSHGGEDLRAAIKELNDVGYSVDIITLDARRFVPQSRPRLFLIAVDRDILLDILPNGQGKLRIAPTEESQPIEEPNPELRPPWLQKMFKGDKDSPITHRAFLPEPPEMKNEGLSGIVEEIPASDERWWDEARTTAFLAQLSPMQDKRLHALSAEATRSVYRTAYRRTRNGVPAWEIRADDIAGCLRTARGGSSKQAVVRVGPGEAPRVRWMTPLEYARLMGADDYRLDLARRNQALFGFGDAVCVPAVQWLTENYLQPLARSIQKTNSM